ncbi:MAG: hypothetical protein IPL65_09555 [Lewinellaceae bacterium]|nr:hypothetical protein [Lewinellaceae bacterium]
MHKYTLPFLLILFSCGRQVPEVQLDAYQLEPGFKLDLVAAEPLLNAPVAMSFDDYGRIWVLEMPGYMADLDNTAETRPVGSIVILKDEDGDGRMDQRKVFLDQLVLPGLLPWCTAVCCMPSRPNSGLSKLTTTAPANAPWWTRSMPPAATLNTSPTDC